MTKQRKPKSWIAWLGMEDGQPAVARVHDGEVFVGRPACIEVRVFKKRSDAEKRYRDVRRIRMTEEPKP